MITSNCAVGTIAPYVPSAAMPWNRSRAIHLYKRMNFGASQQEIDAALQKTPIQLVEEIIDAAIALPLAEEPQWAYWKLSDYTDIQVGVEQIQSWKRNWLRDMIRHGFRDKLALFWHNHFVTRLDDYNCPSYMYQYHKLLQKYALGNFKDFVYEIGKTPAMLFFLNGIQNTKFEPNENYGRELYELFTLGRDNGYNQTDIAQTAKALTGFNGFVEACDAIGFVPDYHDNSMKTIFGRTGNWGYDDVINILFEERADEIAEYICTKLYRNFISYQIDESIVAALASTFKNNDFEIAPVLRQLFKSEHFFDEANINVQIKSPLETLLGFIKDGNFFYDDDEILTAIDYFAGLLGQQLFNPIDVSGWDGDRAWIQNVTLTGRWQFLEIYIFYLYENNPQELINLAKTLTNDSNDPVLISQTIVNHFIPKGLQTSEAYERAEIVFKWEVPQNYYDSGDWNLNWEYVEAQVALLLRHITRQPDFQLT